MADSLKGLINKNWKKTAGPVLVGAGLRTGSTLGGLWLHKMLVTPKDGQTDPPLDPKFSKYAGPAMLAAGLAGEVFMANPYLISISEGLTVAGGMITAKEFIFKENAAKWGLAGIGALTDTAIKPLPASVAEFDFDKALEEANRLNDAPTSIPESGVQGVYGEDNDDLQSMSRQGPRSLF